MPFLVLQKRTYRFITYCFTTLIVKYCTYLPKNKQALHYYTLKVFFNSNPLDNLILISKLQ